MPRNGSGVYSLPAGLPTNGEVSNATDDIRTPFTDVETDLNTARPVVAGGTGATSASAARTNLGLGTIATQASDSVDIDGGAIDGTAIGGTTPAAGAFTTLSATGDTSIAALTATGVVTFSGTSHVQLPLGTDAQRPTGAPGYVRFNSDNDERIEHWDASDAWKTILSVPAAGLVQGAIPYIDSNGRAAMLPIGTSGQLLSAGASDPEYTDAQTGIETEIVEQVMSSDSDFTFTGFNSSEYRAYRIELETVKPATNAVQLRLRVSNDGGTTYITNNTYRFSIESLTDNNAFYIGLTDDSSSGIGNDADDAGVSGEIMIYGAGNASALTSVKASLFSAKSDVSNTAEFEGGAGYHRTKEVHDGVQLYFSSGNIAEGTIRVIGIR